MVHLIGEYFLDANTTFYQIKKVVNKGKSEGDAEFKLDNNFTELKDALHYVMDIAVKSYIGNQGYTKEEIGSLVGKVKELMDMYNHAYEIFYALEGGKKNDSTD